jgi:hypothetical protein
VSDSISLPTTSGVESIGTGIGVGAGSMPPPVTIPPPKFAPTSSVNAAGGGWIWIGWPGLVSCRRICSDAPPIEICVRSSLTTAVAWSTRTSTSRFGIDTPVDASSRALVKSPSARASVGPSMWTTT